MLKQEQLLELFGMEMTQDNILELTQHVRKNTLHEMIANGIPTGKDMYKMMNLMDSMDTTALGVKRADVEDENVSNDKRVADILQSVMEKMPTNYINPPIEGTATKVPEVDISKLPMKEIIEGETEVGVSSITYDSFVGEDPND